VDGFPRNNRRGCDCRQTRGRGQDGRIPHDHTKWDQGGVQHMGIGQEGQRDVRGTYIGCWAPAMLDTRPQIHVGEGHPNHGVRALANLADDYRCSFDCCYEAAAGNDDGSPHDNHEQMEGHQESHRDGG